MSSSKWNAVRASNIETYRASLEGQIAQGKVVLVDDLFFPDFQERVSAGMDLLDKICPGWQDEIDLTTLDLESDEQCVLGQTWPLYAKTHNLIDEIDTGDYKEFADAVLNVGGEGSDCDRNTMAAAIGCAFNKTDADVLNAQRTKEDGLALAEGKCPPIVARTWEHLTKTWIAAITKARAEGRWTVKETVST